MPPHIAKRVVKDREQPRLQVRAALELMRCAKRLQVRVLDEILRVGRTPRQPERRAVQAVDMRQRVVRELLRVGSAWREA